jgi:hypothetical protein
VVHTGLPVRAIGQSINFSFSFGLPQLHPISLQLKKAGEWYFGGSKITTGVTGAVLSKPAATGDAGSYTCKAFKGVLASVASDVLTLTVNGELF